MAALVPQSDKALLFTNVRGYSMPVETQLDVYIQANLIFLGKDKEVVGVEEHVRPFRISRVSLKAASVLELPPHTIYRSGTQVGDRLEISRLRESQQTDSQSTSA